MNKARVLSLLVTCTMILPALSLPAGGDGVWMAHDDSETAWDLIAESDQIAVIDYSDGIQKMVLSVKVPAYGVAMDTESLWMFPVPAAPEEVSLDVVSEIPILFGQSLDDAVEKKISGTFMAVLSTQIYPALIAVPVFLSGYPRPGVHYPRTLLPNDPGYDEVEVFEEVDRYGVTTELIGTNGEAALAKYFSDRGLAMPTSIASMVNEYSSLDQSYVVSYVSDVQAVLENATDGFLTLGILTSFPSQSVFFPTRLTSSYGGVEIPTFIQVTDFVNMGSIGGVEPSVTHYFLESQTFDASLAPFFGIEPATPQQERITVRNLKFTDISFTAPAAALNEDIWIDTDTPSNLRTAEFLIDHTAIFGLLVLMVSSVVASLISGFLTYRGARPALGRFAVLGLANLLTIIGLWMVAASLKIDKSFVRPVEKTIPERSITTYVSIFSVFFLAIAIGTFIGIVSYAT